MKIAVLVIISLFMSTSIVYSQHLDTAESRECHHRQEVGQMRRLEMLDLTDKQREEIRAVSTQVQKTIIPLKAEIELKKIDLHTEMTTDSPNRNTVMKLARDINDIELQIKQVRLDEKLKIHSILTPEQREQIIKKPRKLMQKKIIKRHPDDL